MSIDGTTQVLIAFITGVLGPVLLQYVKSFLEKKKDKKDPLLSDIEYDAIVAEHIENLKDELDADRIWINQFHNGGYFNYSGRSMNKFTMFYETVSPGISTTMSQFQNIPTSLFAKSLTQLIKEGELEIEDFSDESTYTYGLRDTAQSTGCQSLYLIGLKCPTSKRYLGMMGIEHVKEARSFKSKEKIRIKEIGVFLAGVLTQQQRKKR